MSQDNQIDDIKRALNIVSLITEYVPSLKRNGRNHFGLCPFHSEKSPSFSVNEELGIFKCFGCGESGDVLSFIQKIENIDFPKALEIAAQKAGIELKKNDSPLLRKLKKERINIIEANTLATKFYQHILLHHDAGKEAREYVSMRKIPDKQISDFLIGYAPSGYENLKSFLTKKGYKIHDLVEWGLLVEKNNKIYDKFRERLMFPIVDHYGDIVGFSGRIIKNNDKAPKYLNSPETPVYKKSSLLYGLFQAKESIRKAGYVVLVEGNIDILTSHGEGVANIVAPLGTALTDQQISLIKRYSDTVYFAFDSDNAGLNALLKGLEMVEKATLNSKIINLNEFKDVDDLITKGGNWHDTLAKAQSVIPYLIDNYSKKFDLGTAEGKSKFTSFILKYIAKIDDDIKTAHYIQIIASKIQIDQNMILNQLKAIKQNRPIQENIFIEKKQSNTIDLEAYLVGMIYAHKNLLDKENINIIKTQLNSELYKNFLQNIIEKGNLSNEDLTPEFSDIIMQKQSIIYESKEKILAEIDKQLTRINHEKIQQSLIQEIGDNDDENTVQLLNNLAKQKKKFQSK
jgi:DNA primase